MRPMLKVKGGDYKKKSLGGRESRIDLGIEGRFATHTKTKEKDNELSDGKHIRIDIPGNICIILISYHSIVLN